MSATEELHSSSLHGVGSGVDAVDGSRSRDGDDLQGAGSRDTNPIPRRGDRNTELDRTLEIHPTIENQSGVLALERLTALPRVDNFSEYRRLERSSYGENWSCLPSVEDRRHKIAGQAGGAPPKKASVLAGRPLRSHCIKNLSLLYISSMSSNVSIISLTPHAETGILRGPT